MFVEPKITVVKFETEDIITTSSGFEGGDVVLPDDEI